MEFSFARAFYGLRHFPFLTLLDLRFKSFAFLDDIDTSLAVFEVSLLNMGSIKYLFNEDRLAAVKLLHQSDFVCNRDRKNLLVQQDDFVLIAIDLYVVCQVKLNEECFYFVLFVFIYVELT